MKRVLISGILIGLFITIGTIAAVFYATGYRFSLNGGGGKIIEGTGLMVATSRPDGARVLVNGRLTTATNNTINLAPDQYDVQIEKDGYTVWKKKILIKNGLVSEANALLFPVAPKLEAITTIGVSNVVMDPSGSLLAYTVASSSAAKNGIYVLNMNSRPLIFLGATGTQIASDTIDQFSGAKIAFSPDGKQLLAHLPSGRSYLLTTDGRNETPQNVTNTLFLVERDWREQRIEKDKKTADSFSRELRKAASVYFRDILLSPEGDRILYTASESATLPLVLKKKIPSLNSVPDQRNIKQGSVYIYDIKEDKNYQIDEARQPDEINQYFWHADSRHLIYANDGKINILEYDGGNHITVYSGPFLDNLVFPWPDGGSIAIVSRLSSSSPYNLYRISLQ